MPIKFHISLLTFAILGLISGCGGSENSSSPSSIKQGRAVDGPLAYSTVVFKDCDNQTTSTDAEGYFNFPKGCHNSQVAIYGGFDTTTRLPFSDILTAPKTTAGSIISPLTTLLNSQKQTETQVAMQAEELAKVLGLGEINILTTDPLSNQQLYTQTVLTQHLVEQVKQAIAAYYSNIPDHEFTLAAYAALAQNLFSRSHTVELTEPELITKTLQQTLYQLVPHLPQTAQQHVDALASNIATTTVDLIADNIAQVELRLQQLTPTEFAGGIESIRAATQTDLQTAKLDVTTHNLVKNLTPVLLNDPIDVQAPLTQIRSAVQQPSENTTIMVQNALNTLNLNQPQVLNNILNASEFESDALILKNFTAHGVSYSPDQLAYETVSVPSLDQFQVELGGMGETFAGKTIHVVTSLSAGSISAWQIHESWSGYLWIKTTIALRFDQRGELAAAYIPANMPISFKSSDLADYNGHRYPYSMRISHPTAIQLNTGNKLNLNLALLEKIFPGQKFQHLDRVFNGNEIHISTLFHEHSFDILTAHSNQYRLAPYSTTYNHGHPYYGPGESGYGFSTHFKVGQKP